MTHPGYNHRNLAAVWNVAGHHTDDLSDAAVSGFLRLDPTVRNAVVAQWEDSLEKFTRYELYAIDRCLAELTGKLDGEFEAELQSARRLVFELYATAHDDMDRCFGPWDGRTSPADLRNTDEYVDSIGRGG
jgi:hypothetical protein